MWVLETWSKTGFPESNKIILSFKELILHMISCLIQFKGLKLYFARCDLCNVSRITCVERAAPRHFQLNPSIILAANLNISY